MFAVACPGNSAIDADLEIQPSTLNLEQRRDGAGDARIAGQQHEQPHRRRRRAGARRDLDRAAHGERPDPGHRPARHNMGVDLGWCRYRHLGWEPIDRRDEISFGVISVSGHEAERISLLDLAVMLKTFTPRF